jgi:translation elongation factor EF-Ts
MSLNTMVNNLELRIQSVMQGVYDLGQQIEKSESDFKEENRNYVNEIAEHLEDANRLLRKIS